ncbi:MAG: endo-1,4-beta-xylanase [Kiritimatiellae bacterium]|jgi:endo-1,4-beta-xylanase|nr:endo-1,4-beta-xylanase [Kiritimatiellia bacterium]
MITSTYKKLWNNSELQTRIGEGIRQNRQSEATVETRSYDGTPLPGVRIRVQQQSSPFHFGANIFKLDDYPHAESNRRYEEAFCALFNGATVPFYWRALEPEQGRPRYKATSKPQIVRRPPPDLVVEFCERHGLRMHGHTLLWNYRKWSVPDWLPENPDEARPYWEKRFQEIGERYGHVIKSWDVVNEAAGFIDKTVEKGSAHSPMFEEYERTAFEWAEKYFPADCRFDINDTAGAWDLEENGERYTRLIKQLQKGKERIGGIGLQFHLFADEDLHRALRGDLFPPDQLFKALDHFAKFGKPLHISEITLTSPGNTLEGLEAQAEVARNFYRLWFSHPAVTGISWWNLPDGAAAQGEGEVYSGLMFEDLRPKPAYDVLKELIHRDWKTECTGETDSEGKFHFRGFHGTYLVETDSGKRDAGIQSAITLEPDLDAHTLVHLR